MIWLVDGSVPSLVSKEPIFSLGTLALPNDVEAMVSSGSDAKVKP
jgi:hypothetical protein